jgi:pyruvate-ferredoxin/flavodoxin oxidoreductase
MGSSDTPQGGTALQGGSRSPSSEAAQDATEALLRTEALVCRTLFAGPSFAAADRTAAVKREASAGEAVRAAAKLAERGERASALLLPGELLGALEAIAAAAAARAPLVVHVVGPRDEIVRGRDELAPALDAGAGVLVSWSAQDAVDMALAARRAAEDSETPFLHVHDAPRGADAGALLHARELAAHFLGGERRAARAAKAEAATEVLRKRAERSFASRVPFALNSALRELAELTGRPLAAVDRHETHEADEILVAFGSAFVAARAAAWSMREEGRRVGVVGLRALRPFLGADAVKATSRARAVVVLEPLDVALAPAGPVATALKASFADALTWAPGFPGVGRIPPIVSAAFATIEGVIREADVKSALGEIAAGDRARRTVIFGSEG